MMIEILVDILRKDIKVSGAITEDAREALKILLNDYVVIYKPEVTYAELYNMQDEDRQIKLRTLSRMEIEYWFLKLFPGGKPAEHPDPILWTFVNAAIETLKRKGEANRF